MKKLDLNGKWQFKAINPYGTLPTDKRSVTRWMDGTVPGTVHTDLLANKKIPDPFYRMNENDVQWIDSQQWVYRRDFIVPARFLQEDAVHLVAEGLDTYARIRFNGKTVAETANMFIQHRVDVKKYLQSGKNTIGILFDSPTVRSKALEKKYGKLNVVLEPHRVYIRKAQYSFGWDWGPKIITSGIWRSIYLEAYSYARLRNPFAKVVSVNEREAVVNLSVEVERYRKAPLILRTYVAGGETYIKHEMHVEQNLLHFRVRIRQPRLWWPNGFGDQSMYHAVFSLLHKGEVLQTLEVSFAIRTVRLLQENDTEGRSFIFEINGLKIFCKGANWIPSDNIIPRIPDSTYEALLRMAKDAHMNMIRVWAGGIYEQDVFYELCDRLGLMVWQDFMYACGEYPQQSWFLKQAKEEAEKVVRRLRNHPSIVVWCGNNECEWLFCTENPDKTPDDMRGARIFRDLLPAICTKLDGTRPYWRSSPFGRGSPNAESSGNHHQWSVWSHWKDYKEYEKDNARFVTEFGFQAPANQRTFEEVTLPTDRHPQNKVIEHHNKQVEGTERLFRFQSAHYHLSESFNGFIYKGQLMQAEALKCAVEHWRRRKFNTAGALFWQLNDCWPVSSWAVIDSALRPKAAYYFAKKFFAPTLVSFKKTENNIEVWVTSDVMRIARGKLSIALRSFEGKKLWTRTHRVNLPPNSPRMVQRLEPSLHPTYDRRTHYLHAQLWVNGTLASENRWFFEEAKHMQLPKSKVTTTLRNAKNGLFVLTVRSDKFVKNVRVETEGEDVVFDDNYFDIDPGESKEIRFMSKFPASQLKRKLKLHSL